MDLNALMAISPIDGRYRSKVDALAPYFSEYGLIRYRTRIEVEYFIALCDAGIPELKEVPAEVFPKLRALYTDLTEKDAREIKETEKITNHDVKAVEYFIKKRFPALGLEPYMEFVHFGLTSQDINNTAIPLSLKEGYGEVYLPVFEELIRTLHDMAGEWKDVPMLARTHGQPASPTRLGKEIAVFEQRLRLQMAGLEQIPFAAKFGGATGNYNAHQVTYPGHDWKAFGTQFVETRLGLKHSWPTTQIEHYDYFAAFCDGLKRVHNILLDLDRDIWTYISMEYFKQKIKRGETGSSAMPHKVNPIDFENSEGNLGIANALLGHLAAKLPISRLQRDLTDSTVLRNVGMPMAHGLLAMKSTLKGLGKLLLNEERITADLDNNWAVVAEAIQNILRRERYPRPYEALKALTRTNEPVTRSALAAFIDELEVSEDVREEMKKITPHNYTGI